MIVGVGVVLNIIGLLLTPTKMILGYPLSQFCFEPLWSIDIVHHYVVYFFSYFQL